MQRLLLLLSTLTILYACTTPVPHAPVEEKPLVPAAPAEVPKPEEEPVPELILDEHAVPHIAVLLPLKSKDYGSAANAVLQGFLAAAKHDRLELPVHAYSDFDENNSVVAIYRKAVSSGARAVVGPLTRNGVSMLAAESYIPVPTLTLNIVDEKPAQQLYYFGMAIEQEARQAAALARKQGLHQAIIITTRAQLTKRLQSAFEEEWLAAGGGILREVEFSNVYGEFADIVEMPDVAVFLAADVRTARLIRPYIPNKLPIYATSLIFSGNENTLTNYDLNGIHFIDMPWLLQPDHPAVMTYPRSNPPLTIDRERLYALGIDAFRLTSLLLSRKAAPALPLDGVTGDLSLRDHVFQREAMPAVFLEGRSQIDGKSTVPAIQMFPHQQVNVTP